MKRKSSVLPLLGLAGLCALPVACGRGGAGTADEPAPGIGQVAVGENAGSQLFSRYRADGPSKWNGGWTGKFDLSGVSFDKITTATAITPRHVVMAAHCRRKAGERVVFHDRDGGRHQRVVEKFKWLGDAGLRTDIAVGLLDEALPASVRHYPVLKPVDDPAASLVGARVLVTEQKRRLYFHQVAHVAGTQIRFRFDRRLDESWRKVLIKGDSGNPAFIPIGGQLVLVETHQFGGAGSGPFYGSKEVVDTLRRVVADLDPDYQVRTVAIDDGVRKDAREGAAAVPKPKAVPPAVVKPPAPAVVPGAGSPTPTGNGTSRRPRKRVAD